MLNLYARYHEGLDQGWTYDRAMFNVDTFARMTGLSRFDATARLALAGHVTILELARLQLDDLLTLATRDAA